MIGLNSPQPPSFTEKDEGIIWRRPPALVDHAASVLLSQRERVCRRCLD
jgi:hypothetical protein